MSISLRRLGAVSAVGLGALILTTVLAGPALAWHSVVTVSARCLDGQVRIHYRVESWEKGHEAVVKVRYDLNGEVTELPPNYFGPQHNQFSGHFDLPPDTTGTITFTADAQWKDAPPTSDEGSAQLPKAGKCAKDEEPTPTTTEDDTTSTTEGEDVLGSSTTVTPGLLPFTGATSVPMLLAGIGLVGGGLLFLWSSRPRGRHAAR